MCNNLSALPDEICDLTSLYRLGVKSNQLAQLPDNFGALVNLVELFLTDNCLKRFPQSLQHCTALVKLQVCITHRAAGHGVTCITNSITSVNARESSTPRCTMHGAWGTVRSMHQMPSYL